MGELKKTIIAGPCALESLEQLSECVQFLKAMGIRFIRASLWKPRTSPAWDGLGIAGLPMLLEATLSDGLIPCTEILTAHQTQLIVDALKYYGKKDSSMLLWIGARNQNHFEQRLIIEIIKDCPNILFMFKNQLWYDKKHWMGIFEHIVQTGFPAERLIACHRGFSPGYHENKENLRNIPEFEMSMELKNHFKIPMYLDPSHIGGERAKVIEIAKQSLAYDFDGYLVEVHPNVQSAKTDKEQQLTLEQFEHFVELVDKWEPLAKVA